MGCSQADRTYEEAGQIDDSPPDDAPRNPPSNETDDGNSTSVEDDRRQCSPSANAESLCPDLMKTTTAEYVFRWKPACI